MALHLHILGSSSAGNAALLVTPQCRVLIDAGFSARRLKSMLAAVGQKLENLDAVFLTHEHGDHTSGLRGLSKIPGLLFFTTRATREFLAPNLPPAMLWKIFESGSSFLYKDLRIDTFSVPHDAYDPVGYFFSTGGEDLFNPYASLAWCTDLGHLPVNVKEKVREADVLVLEANHDLELLEKDSRRPWSTKQRIRGRHGHLSNDAVVEFLRDTVAPRWQRIFLTHLSKDCNDPALLENKLKASLNGHHRFTTTIIKPADGPGEPCIF
jgi:phosphoribosyl 1,2-cyclic phosphodiesterase